MRVVATVLRALPLTALFLALGGTSACSIVIDNSDGEEGEGEGGDCQDLGDVCPSLSCENGNVLDAAGCPICECNTDPECNPEDQPLPGCFNPTFDEQACAWTCGGDQECTSDVDCGRGSVCVITGCGDGGARPDDGGNEGDPDGGGDAEAPPVDCIPEGFCQAIATDCFSDSDCGDGFRCSFDGQNDVAPPPPDDGGEGGEDGGAAPEEPVPPPGQCVPVEGQNCFSDEDCERGQFCDGRVSADGDVAGGVCRDLVVECFDDSFCAEGQHCEFNANAGGLIVLAGICVDDQPVSECSSDEECVDGAVCVIECGVDPNCPNCDICLVIGKCVAREIPCSSDLDCGRGQVCSFGGQGDRAIPCFDENNDGVCDDVGLPPPQGVCIDVIVDPSCTSDADCGEGQACELREVDCVCDASCQDDGMGGCLPCVCPNEGTCVDVPPTACSSDEQCGRGQVCELACACPAVCEDDGMGGCVPCACPTEGTCVDVQEPECRDDSTCAPGETCVIRAEGCDGSQCERDAEGNITFCHPCDPVAVGRCTVVESGCSGDFDCGPDEQCVFADGFAPPPPCDDPAGCDGRPAPAPEGTCEPRATDPCADIRCENGRCEVGADGTATCVGPAVDCTSDADCAAGELCNASTVCNPDPNCQPGEACPDVCHGTCFVPDAN